MDKLDVDAGALNAAVVFLSYFVDSTDARWPSRMVNHTGFV